MGRTDTRTYGDRKKLYEGGWEVVRAETLETMWKEKYDEWTKRPKARLPKWFGGGPAKNPEMPRHPKVKRVRMLPLKRKSKRKRRKKRRRRKKKRRSKLVDSKERPSTS